MLEPRKRVEQIEAFPSLPPGTEERFSGYGVMGLPFRSGHVLGLRRFTASSLGPGYTSVWHREPSGEWTFYQDAPPEQSCPRYFGPALRRSIEGPIEIRWTGPDSFTVEIDGGEVLRWELSLGAPATIRAINLLAGRTPAPSLRNKAALSALGLIASRLLGVGRLALTGSVPSGQSFLVSPLAAWTIPVSRARVNGTDLGELGPLSQQARLGDFWIPQRGLFVIGQSFFEAWDATRHRSEVRAGESASAKP